MVNGKGSRKYFQGELLVARSLTVYSPAKTTAEEVNVSLRAIVQWRTNKKYLYVKCRDEERPSGYRVKKWPNGLAWHAHWNNKHKKNWRQTEQSDDATLPARVVTERKKNKGELLPASVANCRKKRFPCSPKTNPSLILGLSSRRVLIVYLKFNRTEKSLQRDGDGGQRKNDGRSHLPWPGGVSLWRRHPHAARRNKLQAARAPTKTYGTILRGKNAF